MLEEYIKDGVFDLKGLEQTLFEEEYEARYFYYTHSKYPDIDHEYARGAWEHGGLFKEVLKERFTDAGCKEWDDDGLVAGFVWVRELDLLMALPKGDGSKTIVAECNRGGLEELEYASGFMIMGWFFVQAIAEKVIA